MNDAQRRWLRSATAKSSVILVQLDYMYQVGVGTGAVPTLGTKYLSTAPYVDQAVPRRYDDCVSNSGLTFARALDRTTLRGKYLPQVGSIEISSGDGRHDDLLDLAIDGSEVRVYIGEPTWAVPATVGDESPATFIHLFSAQSLLAAVPSHDTIRITLRDAGVLLNKSIGGMTAVGGTEPSANRFRPVNFGFVHQAAPILLDHTIPRYVHSDTGTNTAAVAVRNDGVAVTFTDNADGTFDLAVPPTPNETITCDVLADADGTGLAYRGSNLIEWLVGDRCGFTAAGRFLGPGAMYELHGVNDYHLGYNITESVNVANKALDDVMNSLNAFWAIDRQGRFFYNWMRPSAIAFFVATAGVAIEREIKLDDSIIGEFRIAPNAPTYTGYQAIGNVNWFDQQTFSSSLTDTAARDQYTRKGIFIPGYYGEDPGTTSYLGPTSYQGGAPQLYHLTLSDTPQISTLISGPDDTTIIDPAQLPGGTSVEANLTDWSAVRRSQMLPWLEYLDLTGGLDLCDLELGAVVNVTHPRYGLSAGILYQVCSNAIDAGQRRVALGMVRRRYAGVFDTEGDSLELREDGGFELREDGGEEVRE